MNKKTNSEVIPMQNNSLKKKRSSIIVAFIFLILISIIIVPVSAPAPGAPALLDPKTIPKYENQITGPPPVYVPVSGNYYEVNVTSFSQQILPPSMGMMTPVWGYGGLAKDAVSGASLGFVASSPGPSFYIDRGTSITVKWINEITTGHMFAVDPTLHWANPNNMPMMPPMPWPLYPPGFPQAQANVSLVTHLHGAEVLSTSDGYPDAWFTANGLHGPAYNSEVPGLTNAAVYAYPNTQQGATLWYHDHALGITRINVMSGLAGFYLLNDTSDPVSQVLPSGAYDVPLVIQDRSFNPDGSFWFPTVGLDTAAHPYWMPEFFGNTIMVNGLVWPNMNVNQGTYRFRLLDGSNARFYTLSFSNKMSFTQIGSDGGYLKAPVTLTELTIAPGERADILVDFSKLAPGTKVILTNTGKAPTPRGAPADPQTTGQVMQFTVTATPGPAFPTIPAPLNPTLTGVFPNLPTPTKTRILTLQEVMGPLGPTEILLDGQKWAADISELPAVGTTEDWVIVNPTADTHPIHLHLVQFQLVSRQPFQVKKYQTDWMAINGMPPLPLNQLTKPLNPIPYLQGKPVGPTLQEQGWKDTIQMRPGEVTTIRVRFAAQDGAAFGFDATTGPGYVWHCHILDHEDNEMMRPYKVV
jgi:spore coat protein A